MKMNEVLPDLAQAMDAPDNAPAGSKPTGTKKPMSPGQQRQQKQQQGSKFGQHRKSGQQQGQQQPSKTTPTNKELRPGQKVSLPTDQGDEQEFKITRDMGNEVEIENPEGATDPSQPNRVVYNKSDLEKALRNRK